MGGCSQGSKLVYSHARSVELWKIYSALMRTMDAITAMPPVEKIKISATVTGPITLAVVAEVHSGDNMCHTSLRPVDLQLQQRRQRQQ